MRMFIAMALVLTAVGGMVVVGATERKAGTRAKYYRKASKPNPKATRAPAHKDLNYDQHGWN